jgi:hypothetical protein
MTPTHRSRALLEGRYRHAGHANETGHGAQAHSRPDPVPTCPVTRLQPRLDRWLGERRAEQQRVFVEEFGP